MSTATKAERARTIIRSLERDLYNAIALEAILSRANDDTALHEAYNHTYEVHGLNIIHHTLINELIMTLMRMHDPGAGNRASLDHLFGLLDDETVMAVFRQEARDWLPGILDLADDSERAVVDAVGEARSAWKALMKRELVERLREYRNRHLAHSLIEMPDADRPIYNDMLELLDGTSQIVKRLLLAVTGKSVDVDEVREVRRTYADAFWGTAVAGVLASKDRAARK